MKWKHLFPAWNEQNPTGRPGNSGASPTPQAGDHIGMDTVYPTWDPVSTASQEEQQIPDDVDEAALQEAAANLHQALESLKQATEEWNATLWEMRDVAEKNHGEIPDVNRMAEEVLAQSQKGEDET